MVELTIALHYVFDTPDDRLVWDVGHQAYPHKILTERRELMGTLRQKNGLAAFPRRAESEYDTFGVGHSSTSISAALGMAIAARLQGKERKSVAVIGDGALTAGMAFEALNHASEVDADMLVILNDNDMSISHNVGGLSNYLAKILSSRTYSSMREGSKKVLSRLPGAWEIARRTEEYAKGMLVPGTLFEELGWNYIGPIDGHDLPTLVATLRNMRDMKGPQFLHVVTKKGKGFAPAELDPIGYHAITKLEAPGSAPKKTGGPKYSSVFGQWLCDMAAQDAPARHHPGDEGRFRPGGLQRTLPGTLLRRRHRRTACRDPGRRHGLRGHEAGGGDLLDLPPARLRPVDPRRRRAAPRRAVRHRPRRPGRRGRPDPRRQLRHLLPALHPRHAGDDPSDEDELRKLLTTGYLFDGPAAVRYPRGSGPNHPIDPDLQPVEIGKGVVRRRGGRVALLVFGVQLAEAMKVAESLDATVVDMRFVKPLDEALVREFAGSHELLVTIEENAVMGGAGSAVGEFLASEGLEVPLLQLGLPDYYVEHAKPSEMLAECGLDAAGIEKAVRQRLDRQ